MGIKTAVQTLSCGCRIHWCIQSTLVGQIINHVQMIELCERDQSIFNNEIFEAISEPDEEVTVL